MQQHQHQQQLINQQNNLTNIHQQQLGSNVPGLQQQQQQLLGTQSGNSSMQTNQHSVHMLQQSKVPMQQQQNASNLLSSQGQQAQPQPPQLPQIQSQSAQLQQQLSLQQQQPNPLQRDMQQRIQASGPLLQQQNVLDQQKQLYQSQRALPEASSTSMDSTAQTGQANGGDWQEEVYQKIKNTKELYFADLHEMHNKIALKLQQHDSVPQQPKPDPLEKLRVFKSMLERLLAFLQVSKSSITPSLKDKLGAYEKQIIHLINTNRPRRPNSAMQQGQLPPPHMHSMQQPQSQVHENQMNSQLQSTNLPSSIAAMQNSNNMTSLQQNMRSSLQSAANMDSGTRKFFELPAAGCNGIPTTKSCEHFPTDKH
ncbi:mediator of RNA polymerase II transcription subunit 15a [Quillaja saponaria]|uniref:Mediator of RNA polymerase II transcription subunit 15a n=1 Tax=Quillaja saponaria TaxID=32244 RepID=A0AAD7L5H4_QUISA|nr:mediator of RNA polymerase II transcription subunit 15a [Quillaja saponaria]